MSEKTIRADRLDAVEIEALVAPMLLQPLPATAYALLARYLELLFHWNRKMNLTAVRDCGVLVKLHLAECLRAAQRVPEDVETVLDFGSGAGLPGIPIQIARPELRVTLAESQKKKAGFLREAIRELNLRQASVYSGRVEGLPGEQLFDLVALRAVDKMEEALASASHRIQLPGDGRKGWCMVLTSRSEAAPIQSSGHRLIESGSSPAIDWLPPEGISGTDQRVILLGSRVR
ncbi:MAG: 16S rRNA (guanine(527)-N(7))-methyltransferase RsmG [Acidobacteriaceae bacterium]